MKFSNWTKNLLSKISEKLNDEYQLTNNDFGNLQSAIVNHHSLIRNNLKNIE